MKTTYNKTNNRSLLEPVKEPFIEQGCIVTNRWDEMSGRLIKTPYAISLVDRIERYSEGYIADRLAFNQRVSEIEREEELDHFAAYDRTITEHWRRLPTTIFLKSGKEVIVNNSLAEYVGSGIPLIRIAKPVTSDETVEVEASDHNGDVKAISLPLREIEAIFTYHRGPVHVFKDKAEINSVVLLKSRKFVLITNSLAEFVQHPITLQILPRGSYMPEMRSYSDLELCSFDYSLAINDLPDAGTDTLESGDKPEATTEVAT